MRKIFSLSILFLFLFLPLLVKAEEVLGKSVQFYIESSYDTLKRDETTATLKKLSPRAYWYIDDNWWSGLEEKEKEEVNNSLDSLIEEFETALCPVLTLNFGSEWSPGIDKDLRITILFHPMSDEAGGYFNSGDEYPRIQVSGSRSNEREMIYLNSRHLKKTIMKSLLAHEFQHLISFNQKEKTFGASEDVWLNEARSEYAPVLLGYDENFEGSNLQRRLKNFLDKPYDSLTEWRNVSYDYGVANLFIQYLVDQYGRDILFDSLKSPKTGIESLNSVLSKRNFKEDFSQIFTDWTIAVLVNDCSISQRYCYLNSALKNFKLTPLINYLPFMGESVLSVTNTTKNWAGNWHKFIGGKGTLKLEFAGSGEAKFRVPFLVQDSQSNFTVNFLELNKEQKGEIFISEFGSKNISLTIIPSIQSKISGFSEIEPSFSFFWTASTFEKTKEEKEAELVHKLQAQIEQLKNEIARVRAQIDMVLGKKISCQKFEENLYYGMRGSASVRCLQELLKAREPELYLSGLATGNFFSLTREAVIRFQEKYADEILKPSGLKAATGFVGPATRAKLNVLLIQ